MNIHQLSVRYLPEQNRILLSVNTTDGQELDLWLTRRMVLAMSPQLNRIAMDHFAVPADPNQGAARRCRRRARIATGFAGAAVVQPGAYAEPIAGTHRVVQRGAYRAQPLERPFIRRRPTALPELAVAGQQSAQYALGY